MEFFKYLITKKFNNYSVLDYLKYHHVSKKIIYQYSMKDKITINNTFCDINSILKENDILGLLNEEEIDFIPYDRKIDILYETNDLLIINKPSDILVHPDSIDNNKTLVNIVANYYYKNNIKSRVYYIHRLDKDTTGIIIFVKGFLMSSFYNYLLKENKIKRSYLLLVDGILKNKKGTLKYNISKNRHQSNKMVVSKNGQEAITKYKVLKEYNNKSLVQAFLLTGRTHQLRVHFSYIKHPIIGDVLYNSNTSNQKLCLHSYSVEIDNLEEVIKVSCEDYHFKNNK